jgi:sulfide:quinone oxidoreductase
MRVLIAGGGPAALEAALALHRLAEEKVTTTLLAPESTFTYRPLSVLAPFSEGEPPVFELEQFAADAHFTHRRDRLHAVDPAARTVTTISGDTLDYDALLIAAGARPLPVPKGMVAFSGSKTDQERIHGIVQDVEEGYLRRIAFVVPGDRTWPLPLYELALMLAERAFQMWNTVDLHLVAAHEPLAVFGEEAARSARRLLTIAKIKFDRTLPEGMDRVITVPKLEGPRLEGLPADGQGFLLTDAHGRVRGVPGVYAAGDVTAFPLKHGGIACQQADAAAAHIAAQAGAGNALEPFVPDLQGLLLTGQEARFLHRGARPVPVRRFDGLSKIAGRELTGYLQGVSFAGATDRFGTA